MVLLAAGCKDDVIARYQVPKDQKEPQRLLGAIVPRDDRTWFFKLVGPESVIDKHAEEFDTFIRSVRFTEKKEQPVIWTIPEGWREKPGAKLRHATFVLGPRDAPLELTVIPLGRLGAEAGSLLGNVNRWRKQINLPDVTEAELPKLTRDIKVDGNVVTLVDMKAEAGVAFGPVPGVPARPTFKAPKGWEKASKPARFSIATFEIKDGDQQAIVTVSQTGGSLLINVNRWRRDQLGLEEVDAKGLVEQLTKREIGGVPGYVVDLVSPESDGAKRKRILVGIVPAGGQHWYFKLTGPADLVEKQKSAFETFLKSVRFDGAVKQ